MINLPSVTLIALTGINIEQHRKALEYSCRGINFGAVKLIEKESPNVDEWCRKIVFDLGDYVDTSHCLLIHADGYVVNPEMWKDEWLGLDYLGSPWPLPNDTYSYRTPTGELIRVGNSVGLRSKKLLDLPKKLNLPWKSWFNNFNEDGFLCCHHRAELQKNGCVFGTFEQALEFGRETVLSENTGKDTFLFHDFGGENEKYRGLI